MSLMRSLHALVLGVAQTMFCAGAYADAKTIPADEMVPYAFDAQLPTHASDGRTIPTRGDYRTENLLLALRRLGLMPEHPGIGFQQILDVFKAVAWFTEQGQGQSITQAALAEKVGCSVREVYRVCEWGKDLEWLPYWNRFREDDRLKHDDGSPATPYRNNVYLLLALPRAMAARFTEEEILDMMALGKKKPMLPELDLVRAARAQEEGSTGQSASPRAVADPDFSAFVRAFDDARFAKYGDRAGGTLAANNRAKVAGYVADLVGQACAWAAGRGLQLERAAVRADLCGRVVQEWLTWSGTNDILHERRHPIGLIVGDLAQLTTEMLRAWKKAQPRPAPRPLPPAVAAEAAEEVPELDVSEPAPGELEAIRDQLARALDPAPKAPRAAPKRPSSTATPRPRARAPDDG